MNLMGVWLVTRHLSAVVYLPHDFGRYLKSQTHRQPSLPPDTMIPKQDKGGEGGRRGEREGGKEGGKEGGREGICIQIQDREVNVDLSASSSHPLVLSLRLLTMLSHLSTYVYVWQW